MCTLVSVHCSNSVHAWKITSFRNSIQLNLISFAKMLWSQYCSAESLLVLVGRVWCLRMLWLLREFTIILFALRTQFISSKLSRARCSRLYRTCIPINCQFASCFSFTTFQTSRGIDWFASQRSSLQATDQYCHTKCPEQFTGLIFRRVNFKNPFPLSSFVLNG